MIELFVKRPATTVMFVLVFVVMGVVSYFNLPIENTPKIDFPLVTVRVTYPGATPVEIETQVVKKIEDQIAQISGIEKLNARVYESFAFIIVEFDLESDANIKAIEVKDKVEAIQNDLPSGAKKPIVEKFDPFSAPVVDLALTSTKHDEKELYEYADKTLKNKFSAISGVSSVDVYGGKERQINVNLDPMLMKKYYIGISDVIEALQKKNLNVPGGTVDQKDNSFSVRFVGEFSSLEEIANMTLVSGDGVIFKLKDIGSIIDSYKKQETSARYSGKESVGLALMKAPDANAVSIGNNVISRLPEIQKMLPEGMTLSLAADNTQMIVKNSKGTEQDIFIGILLTIIILYLFTGNIKLTVVSALVIPTSIISTFFLMDMNLFTINMMTLMALATCLGTLIANAIVIIESVISHIEKGKDSITAAIDGTKEVLVAVVASAGTNLVVFTPIAFMGGIVGQFMRQFGLTVVFATIFSIIASFSLTPMLCSVFLKNYDPKKSKRANFLVSTVNKFVARGVKEYKILFDLIFRYPKITLLFSLIIFIGSFSLVKYVGNDFMPKHDEDKVAIDLTLPQGTTLNKTISVVKTIENIVKEIPEVTSYVSSIGQNGAENANMIINLLPLKKRTKSDQDIINLLIEKTAIIPDAEINFKRGSDKGGMGGDVSIEVFGVDYDSMVQKSKEMMKIMQDSGYFRSVKSSYKVPKNEVRFIPNQTLMTDNGISNSTVANAIRSSIYGDDTNIFKENSEEYKISISLDDFYKQDADDIKQIHLISKKGGILPISALGNIEQGKAIPTIWRKDKDRIIAIDGYISKSSAGQVREIISKDFDKKLSFLPGEGYRYVGNAEFQKETGEEILKAFIIASVLTYMLLAALLNSFVHPFSIASCIPTAIVGVIGFLFFGDHSINIASMLAIVMLVGLVVNNAILMLDHAMQKYAQGVSLQEAIWLGASEKFRAILMTSIAIIAGAMPPLWSVEVVKASMSAVLIGGMIGSIFFTLITVPVIFWYIERGSKYFSGVKS